MRPPRWIEVERVLTLHDRLLELDGGLPSLRDKALLQSALARPKQYFAFGDTPDIIDMATAYTFGILRNHPFFDGNKRTAFVVGILFLELNGYRFTGTEEAAAHAVLDVAAGSVDEAAYVAFLRANTEAN